MFFICMICHGELARLKPSPRHLTEFYLDHFGRRRDWRAVGRGDRSSDSGLQELRRMAIRRRGVVSCWRSDSCCLPGRAGPTGHHLVRCAHSTSWHCCSHPGCSTGDLSPTQSIDRGAEFLRGRDGPGSFAATATEPAQLLLVHGRITHGCQATDPDKRNWITSYYSEDQRRGTGDSAISRSRGPIRVGAIGSGHRHRGGLRPAGRRVPLLRDQSRGAAAGREVLSRTLSDCRGKWDIVLGDARLSLEGEPKQKFNVLIVDAFSGDAIPTHLLTVRGLRGLPATPCSRRRHRRTHFQQRICVWRRSCAAWPSTTA